MSSQKLNLLDVSAQAVHVTRLRVTNFRNYNAINIAIDAPLVCVTGANGAGKSNLLEAVSLLAPGRGMRGDRADCWPRWQMGENAQWAVRADVLTRHGPINIATGNVIGQSRRQIRIDDTDTTQADLEEYVQAVWLTPQMDRLFSQNHSGRRRFLDRLIQVFDRAHSSRCKNYENLVRQRNVLLAQNHADQQWIGAIEARLAQTGIALAVARLDACKTLSKLCAIPHGSLPALSLAMGGALEDWLQEGSALLAEEKFVRYLHDNRARDRKDGSCSLGAHKSALHAMHIGYGVDAGQCSTGEQKAMLFALIFAHVAGVAANKGVLPIVMIDELPGHLDDQMRAEVLQRAAALNAQCWFSGTDISLFAKIHDSAQCISIKGGTINPAKI